MESHVGFTAFRQNLAGHLDAVIESGAPLYVTRQGKPSVVVMSEEDYRGIEETLYLLSSPRNAEHLLQGVAELNAGKGVERDIIEK